MFPDHEIQSCLDSDLERGFDALFGKYYRSLVVYAFRMTGKLSTAEDVVQDVFCNLLDGHRYRTVAPGRLSSYLFSAVRNTALNAITRERRVNLTESMHSVGTDDLPEIIFDDTVIEVIREEIGRLSPRTRELISDIVLGGMRYQEAADKYAISINTVKTLLRRGMGRLRKVMEERVPGLTENF